MSCRRLLVTNNPSMRQKVISWDYVSGNSFDVLVRARDLIHAGWVLLTHPLYGNLRPHQHPYRSVLLERHEGTGPVETDGFSVDCIENALSVYSSGVLEPEGLPEDFLRDFSFVDFELMKESLLRYGMFLRETPCGSFDERR